MSVDILGTSGWDQCRSMVQYSFTSTETRRLVRPPPLSHSSWTMSVQCLEEWCNRLTKGGDSAEKLDSWVTEWLRPSGRAADWSVKNEMPRVKPSYLFLSCPMPGLEDVLLPSTGQDGTEQTRSGNLALRHLIFHWSVRARPRPRSGVSFLQSLSRNCYLSTSFFQTLDKTKRNKWFSSPSHCLSFSSFNGYLSVSQVLVARDPASRVSRVTQWRKHGA